MEWIIAVLAGAATGVLSGLGVGGGSLLLIYLTNFTGAAQNLAQGINLLYFLPAAATALPAHVKNGYVERPSARGWCAPPWRPGPPPPWTWGCCASASGGSCWSSGCGNYSGRTSHKFPCLCRPAVVR